MEDTSHSVSGVLKRFGGFRYKVVFESICVGALTGGVVVAFRLILEKLEHLLGEVAAYAGGHPAAMAGWFGVLLAGAVIVTLLLKWEPMISGSGIPQMDGEIQGYFYQNWWRVLAAKFAGGIISIGSGLSLGREGPSIQLGAMVGKGFSRVVKRMRTEEKLLITCGASAGLSAAFNAPLAGALFALEEVHKSFSVEVLLSAMTASITSDFVSRNVFGLQPVFDFSGAVAIPLSHFWIVLLLGIFVGLFGTFYNWLTGRIQDLYDKIPRQLVRTLIPFVMAGVMLFVCPALTGGGNNLVLSVAQGLPLTLLLVYLTVKLLFSVFSFGSGVPGGIFLPMLVLGSLCGGIFHGVCEALGADLNLLALVILGMAGCFAAIVRAPVTGILLITEMTGNFSHLLFVAMVSVVAYSAADLLHGRPIYDQLLRRMLLKQGKRQDIEGGEKVLIEASVCLGAKLCGRKVKEVNMPSHSLIISVKRGEREIVPYGETVIEEGDVLVILCDELDGAAVSYAMEKQCKSMAL